MIEEKGKNVVYYQGTYPKDHWALKPCLLKESTTIALATFKRLEFGVYLHPSDMRGCRSIIAFQCKKNMSSTFNRPYTTDEKIGLALVQAMMLDVYGRLFPIAQAINAGNNAQEFDQEKRVTLIGTPKEPSRLNAHIFGRGDPLKSYIPGVPLHGPEPGIVFNPRSDGTEPGNERSVKWTDDQMRSTKKALRAEIAKVKTLYKQQGLLVK